jgi:hypothetical protein
LQVPVLHVRTQLYDRQENGCRITVHNYTFYPCLPPVRLSCGINEVAKPVRELRFLIGPGSGNAKRRKVLAVADLVLYTRFAFLHQSLHRLNDSLPEWLAHLMTKWRRPLLGKIVTRLAKILIPRFSGRFITICAVARDWILSQASSLQTTLSQLISRNSVFIVHLHFNLSTRLFLFCLLIGCLLNFSRPVLCAFLRLVPPSCITIILAVSALETAISQKTSVCLRVVQWQTQTHTNTERTVRMITVLRTLAIKRHGESTWYSVSIWRTLKKLFSRSWFTPVALKRMTGFFRLVGASVPCWYTSVKECWEFLLTALVVRWRPKV